MTSHFAILQVVLPLLAAPVMILARRGVLAWLIAVAVCVAVLAIAGWLFVQTGGGEVISYAIGSWPPPWGIEYRIDAANAYVMLLVAIMGLVVVLYSRKSIAVEIPVEQHYLFYSMFALCLTGLLGMAATGDAFNLFVFLEIASLSTYVLIALGRDRRALVAAYQYFITGTIGATFIVIGVGLAYLETGTLNLADMATRLPELLDQRSVRAALAFLTVGVSLKLALFPVASVAAERIYLRAFGGRGFSRGDGDEGVRIHPAAPVLQRVRRGLRVRRPAGGSRSDGALGRCHVRRLRSLRSSRAT